MMENTINKHLLKIISEYLHFSLPFNDELLNKTIWILRDTSNFIFYTNRYRVQKLVVNGFTPNNGDNEYNSKIIYSYDRNWSVNVY
jgi:hypothetical protein